MPTKIATYRILMYKHQQRKDGTFPIVLQITYNRKSFRVSLKLYAIPDQWNEDGECFNRKYRDYRDYNEILRGVKGKVERILDDYRKQEEPFTKRRFLIAFLGDTSPIGFFEFVEQLENELKTKEKYSTAANFRATANHLHNFLGQIKSLSFTDINFNFLKRLEVYLLGIGINPSGVRDYLRHVRTIFNKAINRGIVEERYYPFATRRNNRGYSFAHLKSKINPRALSEKDMQKIKDFPVDQHPRLKKHWLYFLFSYYTRGMNYKDMAVLEKSQLYDNRINYTRSKSNTHYSIKITPTIQEILNNFQTPNKYVFPILTDHTGKAKENKITTERKKFNRDLKEIASILGIEVNLTSYVARHTYANALRRNNVNIDVIAQALGHQDIKTTKHYLSSFEDQKLDELDELL